MAGIKESLEVVDLLKKFSSIVKDVNADGVVNIWDAFHFLKLYQTVCKALENADQIKAELLDLDDKEKNMLIQEMQDAIFMLIKSFKL